MDNKEAIEKIAEVNAKLGGCPYDSLIFPTTIKEAGKFLTDKGLTDREKSAVSGTIARLGWENAVLGMWELGYRLPPAEEELLEHEIKHVEIALKEHYKDEWCSVCDNIARKLGFNLYYLKGEADDKEGSKMRDM